MPTTRHDMHYLNRKVNEISNLCTETLSSPDNGKGVRLHIVHRSKLIELKQQLDRVLKDCADDGYI